MNTDTVKAVQDALAPLANKLGQMGSTYFGYAVQHSTFVGWFYVAVSVFALIIYLLSMYMVYRYWWSSVRDPENIYEGEDRKFSATVFGVIFTAVSMILIFSLLFSGTERVFNPQYTAVNDIITSATGRGY